MPRTASSRTSAAATDRRPARASAAKVTEAIATAASTKANAPIARRGAGNLRPLPQLVRRTLKDNVYDYIREALMAGEFAPGDRLTVRGVAGAIGTSVMPVREAFRRLTSEGALEPLSTGATRVPIYDSAKLQDVQEIRMMVEGLAARRAAHRITDDELRQLEQCNAAIQAACSADDMAAEARENERFHFMIYRAAHSAELLSIIQQLWLKVGPYLAWLLKNQHQLPQKARGSKSFRHHKDLLLALRRHDADQAESALRADLMTSTEILIQPRT